MSDPDSDPVAGPDPKPVAEVDPEPEAEPKSEDWVQNGAVFLWRFGGDAEGFEGWHATADEPGLQSLLELLEMKSADDDDSANSIRLSAPTGAEIRITGCGAPARRAVQWTIVHSKQELKPNDWDLTVDKQFATLQLGINRLAALRDNVRKIQRGGDFSIGSGAQKLRFWYRPSKR